MPVYSILETPNERTPVYELSMGMGLSMQMSQTLSLTQRQMADLRLEQKCGLIQSLLDVVYDDGELIYRPEAICPNPTCRHRLTTVEMLRGFRPDPTDPTTGCPKCQTRFRAKFIAARTAGRVEVVFLCPCQTLSQLRFFETQGQDWASLAKKESGVFRSALFHFGSLKAALQKIGVEYDEPEPPDWQEKIKPFLGILPDALIGRIVKKPTHQIRRFRKKLGLKACDRRYGDEGVD